MRLTKRCCPGKESEDILFDSYLDSFTTTAEYGYKRVKIEDCMYCGVMIVFSEEVKGVHLRLTGIAL